MFIENNTKQVLTLLDKRITALQKTIRVQYPILDSDPTSVATARSLWRETRVWIDNVDRAIGNCDTNDTSAGTGVLGMFAKHSRIQNSMVSDVIQRIDSKVIERCCVPHLHLVQPTFSAADVRIFDDPVANWKSMKVAAMNAYSVTTSNANRLIHESSASLFEAIDQLSRESGVPVNTYIEFMHLRSKSPHNKTAAETTPVFITKKEAARILGISERTLDRNVGDRLVGRIKLGIGKNSAVRFRLEDILAMK